MNDHEIAESAWRMACIEYLTALTHASPGILRRLDRRHVDMPKDLALIREAIEINIAANGYYEPAEIDRVNDLFGCTEKVNEYCERFTPLSLKKAMIFANNAFMVWICTDGPVPEDWK